MFFALANHSQDANAWSQSYFLRGVTGGQFFPPLLFARFARDALSCLEFSLISCYRMTFKGPSSVIG